MFQPVTVSCLEKIFVKVSKGSKASADTPPCGKPGLPSGRFFSPKRSNVKKCRGTRGEFPFRFYNFRSHPLYLSFSPLRTYPPLLTNPPPSTEGWVLHKKKKFQSGKHFSWAGHHFTPRKKKSSLPGT